MPGTFIFQVFRTCHQAEPATGSWSVGASVCLVISSLCGYLEDEEGPDDLAVVLFGGQVPIPAWLSLSACLSPLPREACELGLSSQWWRNLAAHDRARPVASPSPWLCCRETPLLFAPDFVFPRLLCYTEGKSGVAAALPSASRLARMCIGHKENQVRVHGSVHMVTGLEPTDRWIGAYHSVGVPWDSRCPHVGPVPSSEFIPVGGRILCSPQVSWVFKR